MFSHTTLGTNDLDKAEEFYDVLMPALGGEKFFRTDRAVFWAFAEDRFKLALSLPFDGEPATAGNGSMVAFALSSREEVNSLHAKAMSLGSINEGDPGDRDGGMYYGAYFRDPDGNKIAIFSLNQSPVNTGND